MKSNEPTEKQKNALRKFGISASEIAKMDFQAASNRLNILIGDAIRKKKEKDDASASSSGRTVNSPIRAEGNAPSASTSTHPAEGASASKAGSEIREPIPITDEQIDKALEWAIQKATKMGEGDDLKILEYSFRYFDAKIAQLTQQFWVANTKWEQELKRKNWGTK